MSEFGKWIPTSLRLPDPIDCKEYLVTVAHYEPSYNAHHVMVDVYDARDESHAPVWEINGKQDGLRVIAWMPLPEGYNTGKQ